MDSNDVRRQWESRSGEYSPEYYAYYGPDDRSEAVRSILEEFLDRDATVLELGCSSGRHLSYLLDHGFENLSGIELNEDAFDVMADTYPDLAASGTFHSGAIENVIGEFEDDEFDAVYSVETLQHLHPDVEWVFEDIARIADELLVTVENEGSGDPSREAATDVNYVNDDFPLYYRDWSSIFTELGFIEDLTEPGDRDTVRVFRAAQD